MFFHFFHLPREHLSTWSYIIIFPQRVSGLTVRYNKCITPSLQTLTILLLLHQEYRVQRPQHEKKATARHNHPSLRPFRQYYPS